MKLLQIINEILIAMMYPKQYRAYAEREVERYLANQTAAKESK